MGNIVRLEKFRYLIRACPPNGGGHYEITVVERFQTNGVPKRNPGTPQNPFAESTFGRAEAQLAVNYLKALGWMAHRVKILESEFMEGCLLTHKPYHRHLQARVIYGPGGMKLLGLRDASDPTQRSKSKTRRYSSFS